MYQTTLWQKGMGIVHPFVKFALLLSLFLFAQFSPIQAQIDVTIDVLVFIVHPDPGNDSLLVSPNPVSTYTEVKVSPSIVQLEILDLAGNRHYLLAVKEDQSFQMNLPTGYYYFLFHSSQGGIEERLVQVSG